MRLVLPLDAYMLMPSSPLECECLRHSASVEGEEFPIRFRSGQTYRRRDHKSEADPRLTRCPGCSCRPRRLFQSVKEQKLMQPPVEYFPSYRRWRAWLLGSLRRIRGHVQVLVGFSATPCTHTAVARSRNKTTQTIPYPGGPSFARGCTAVRHKRAPRLHYLQLAPSSLCSRRRGTATISKPTRHPCDADKSRRQVRSTFCGHLCVVVPNYHQAQTHTSSPARLGARAYH
ncbi:hypothetical protein BJ546DRAFT_438057 [Cryomyces antarcticus]